MALNLDKLSLWEIAHRWNDADPHQFKDASSIPLNVKDTLRVLAGEVYWEHLYSTFLVEHEVADTLNKKLLRRKLKQSVDDYSAEFSACIQKNVIDKKFLESVIIPYWELEYWCRENSVPFPAFWIAPIWKGKTFIPLPGVVRPAPDQKTDQLVGETVATDETDRKKKPHPLAMSPLIRSKGSWLSLENGMFIRVRPTQ